MILKTVRYMMLAVLTAGSFSNLMAQDNNVGIGTTTPHPAAMLEVDAPGSPKKGILIPNVNTIQLNQMESQYNDDLPAGLLIYETDDGNFWYYKYDDPVPQNPPFGEWVMLESQTQGQSSNVPTGGIIMWSGTIASIPVGWSLCNGTNGTPDLTDKFIISVASSAENPGTAPVPNEFVGVQNGSPVPPQRRFFKLAYIMKL